MKRIVVFFALLLMFCLTVSAAYKIELKDGTYIDADSKPIVQDDFAYFYKMGMYLYLPTSKIDFDKTEKSNEKIAEEQPEIKAQDKESAVKTKPVFINDQDLELIKKRSRLANEPSSPSSYSDTQAPPAASPAPPSDNQESSSDVNALRQQLTDLLGQRADIQQRRDQLRSRLAELNNEYNFSALQNDKERLQSEMNDVQEQLSDTEGDLASIQSSIDSIQQQIAATPVVVRTEE